VVSVCDDRLIIQSFDVKSVLDLVVVRFFLIVREWLRSGVMVGSVPRLAPRLRR